MASEAPPFWWQQSSWRATGLAPFSYLYATVARRQMRRARRETVEAPVLCIGNLTVGGSGKTPVAIAFAKKASERGLTPGILSRGHGGSTGHPHLVDAKRDASRLVGDEPLLLARHAPVAVTKDRAAGARLLLQQGCDFLIMDDGFQSARIRFDRALLVVDARRGVGNGRVIPGGPLRARIVDQLPYADAFLVMGSGTAADAVVRRAARAGKRIIEGRLVARSAADVPGKRLFAFAGIGDPEKFFATLEEAGGIVAAARAFPDHHFYADDELADLSRSARKAGLVLATTEKDAARLAHGSEAARAVLAEALVLGVDTVFDPPDAAERLIEETLAAWRERRAQG